MHGATTRYVIGYPIVYLVLHNKRPNSFIIAAMFLVVATNLFSLNIFSGWCVIIIIIIIIIIGF